MFDNQPYDSNTDSLLLLQVGFKMYGCRGKNAKLTQSAPRRLWDPDIERFSAGGEDSFILTTPASLGRLTHVEIWHDNSGPGADW